MIITLVSNQDTQFYSSRFFYSYYASSTVKMYANKPILVEEKYRIPMGSKQQPYDLRPNVLTHELFRLLHAHMY